MSFTTEVAVRYDDFDTYGHVNNVRYGTYLEEARIDYLTEVIQSDGDVLAAEGTGTGIVIATLELEFEAPLRDVRTVDIELSVPRLGTTSFPIEYEIRDDGDTVATAETTVVTYDREAGEPCPIPDDWREAVTEFEGL
jgi:acyl-CoA thioester hydrolase